MRQVSNVCGIDLGSYARITDNGTFIAQAINGYIKGDRTETYLTKVFPHMDS